MLSKTLRVVTILIVCALILAQVTPALAARGDTIRLSLNSIGNEEKNPSSNPATSSTGQFVAFDSSATLIAGDNNQTTDIFLRDTIDNTVQIISVDSAGNFGNNASTFAAISGSGRYVVFYSFASNLVTGDTNAKSDVFIRDTVSNTTSRVSVTDTAGAQATGSSYNPAISATTGQYVAYQSLASNLVTGDSNAKYDIFIRDMQSLSTKRVSIKTDGTQSNGDSYAPVISADGRYVAFYSLADTLVPGDTNGVSDIFVRDTVANTTTRVSIDLSGVQGNGNSDYPSISSTGRYIAFASTASNLVANDTNGAADIFVRDTQNNTTTRISVNTGGVLEADDASLYPSISADGQYIAFESDATNLVNGDTNGLRDIFVRDTTLDLTTRISLDTSLEQANGTSYDSSISSNGNFVAFSSTASNLVSDDGNDLSDVFLHDQTFSADVTGPDVTINQAAGQADPTSASPINFTAVFNEPIKPLTFIGSDISYTGSTTVASALSATISQTEPFDGTTFNIAVSGLSGNGNVIPAMNVSKITDLSGNPNNASTSGDHTVQYIDITPPSVAISSLATSPINGPRTVAVTFSEPVTGFSISEGDISIGNGTGSNLAGSGAKYTFTLTPTLDGTVTVNIAANKAQDAASNNNLAATQYSVTYDGTAPTTTLNTYPLSADTNTTATFTFSAVDGTGTGVASLRCKLDAASYAACVSPYTSATLPNGSHTFSVYATDNANNADATPATYTWIIDTVPPTVVSSVLANTNPTDRASVGFTVTFSEAVSGVDITDFSLTTTLVTGASISSVTGTGQTRTVTVNTGSGNGTIHLNVLDNNSIVDIASNPLNGAFSTGQTYTVNKIKTFTSIAAHDGWLLESSETSSKGGTLNSKATTFNLGDDTAKKQYRAILSFATGPGLPDTAVITAVTLKLKKNQVVGGGNPITTFQGFMVDIKKGFFSSASTLQISDFQTAPNKSYGPFKLGIVNGWYNINLTTAKSYVNKLSTTAGLTQIRLRFKLDDNNNGIANYLVLYSGNSAAATRPQLVITYYVP